MRRTMLAAASAVLLACLGACADDSDDASGETVAIQPIESGTPTPLDPFAWTDVSYFDYLEAADEIGLRPDVLVPEAGFSSGLDALCRTSAEDMATMRSSHIEDVADSGTYSTAKYRGDEVGLRIGMACPQRMTDWTTAGLEQDGTDPDEQSTVTDDDLDRAAAEEVAQDERESESDYEPDYDEASVDGDDDDSGHHHGTGSSSSTDSTHGPTAGNGDQSN